ncbi:hypothetical protein JAAARDRAFT_198404 [Jaapia argillacea MUCL 33604]|uniref:Uncharacterized protein n=1 Tax=Jaapia argillacea MUCL 33604 TaxID=933084 RepID=A0A067PPH5_9AGAM|nr:hypothetical protein JAAARDRAFT_198404 [Jaapia argillacea MUCL 33604]
MKLYLCGLLNGFEVLSSLTIVNPNGLGRGAVRINDLAIKYPLPCPVTYWGHFMWVLGDDSGEIVVTGTNPTPLELYVFNPPTGTAMSLWSSYGISVNLLRAYLEIFDNQKRTWNESDTRQALVESVYIWKKGYGYPGQHRLDSSDNPSDKPLLYGVV